MKRWPFFVAGYLYRISNIFPLSNTTQQRNNTTASISPKIEILKFEIFFFWTRNQINTTTTMLVSCTKDYPKIQQDLNLGTAPSIRRGGRTLTKTLTMIQNDTLRKQIQQQHFRTYFAKVCALADSSTGIFV